MPTEPKRHIWNRVRDMATVDEAYAIWAAGWYERNEPWLFKDLQKHLRDWIEANRPEVPADADPRPDPNRQRPQRP